MPELFVFIISLIAVIVGADWLGNSASHFAKKFALPKVLIGATIVSFATTLPEITIAGISGLEGASEVGLGTVFGSPLVNIGLMFGILLIFSPPLTDKSYFSRTIKFFLVALGLILILSFTDGITRISGCILIIFGFIYLFIQLIAGKSEESFLEQIENRFEKLTSFFSQQKNYYDIIYFILGSILLVTGAHFLVNSTIYLAEIIGASQVVVGFIIIAFGTSIPEILTTFNSIIRNRPSISAGNLFGASIFDITFALGLSGIFTGSKLDQTGLYFTIGSLAILGVIGLLYIYTQFSPKILGLTLIATYLISIIIFGNIG